MPASIKIENLTKSYGALTVLDNISLQIEPGEFVVFLGPSGCGKSTLLRLIAGLEGLNAGTISLSGVRIDHLPPGQRGVAMVFQSYALYPHMSVAENMSFGLENIGVAKSDIEERISEAARILEIDNLLDRKPAKLSGGQRQRVAIGRAIVKEPKVFLFDEPLSNLDAVLRIRTRLELAQLHQRLGTTMVFVTHDQVEAMTLAHRIVLMNNRRIEQIGTPMQIYRTPATRFVAGFVGSPVMSFLPLVAVRQTPTGVAATIDGIGEVPTRVHLPKDFDLRGAEIGIRAEDTHLVDEGGFELRIAVVEQLGDRTLAYGRLANGADMVIEETGRSNLRSGGTVRFAMTPEAVHLFDAGGKAYNFEEEMA